MGYSPCVKDVNLEIAYSNGWQAWGGTRPWEAFLVQHGNNSRLTRLQTAGAKEKVLLKRTPLFSLLRRN